MPELDDTYLIDKVLSGNTNAYSGLVDKYQLQAYNFALYMLRNKEDADEVVQDAFVKAYNALRTFRKEARFSSWLLKITYNTCLTKLRKKKKHMVDINEVHQEVAGVNNTSEYTDQKDIKKILDRALSILSEEERFIVTLYYYNEQSIKEIAEICDKGPSNVKVVLHRSRKRMLRTLNRLGVNEWITS